MPANNPYAPKPDTTSHSFAGGDIFILDSDVTQGHTLARRLQAEGFTTEVFTRLADLRAANATLQPTAIIADYDRVADEDPDGQTIIDIKQQAGQRSKRPLPVIFISTKSDMRSRLQALRAGSDAYACKPLAIPELVSKLHEIIEDAAAQPYRVLLVDDDKDIAELYTRILETFGFSVQAVTDPFRVMEASFDFRPEAVALDLYLPETSGFEIARILRQEEQLCYVPIVFISAEEDKQIQIQAISEGAFDFLVKPVSPERMTHVLGARARQFRKLNAKLRYLDGRSQR